jgi:ribosome-associated protein
MAIHPGPIDTPDPAEFRVVEISREPIELYKILKFEGMADSGGQARAAVASGQVLVNGAVETRKRKKIVSGDTIEFHEHKIRLQRAPGATQS